MDVASLHAYPVKGCRGIALDAASIDRDSLRHDRRFLVLGADGKFLSQRNVARMAHIDARPSPEGLALAFEEGPSLSISTTRAGPERSVEVWGTACRVVDQGDEAAAFFERVLGKPARLVQLAGGFERPLHPALGDHPTGTLRFADAAPLLVTSEASLDDLNGRLDEPIEMERFRPNIVIRGCDAYAEDDWSRIRVGEVELEKLVACGRCVVTTIHPLTLERGVEPLKTLATYRRDDDLGVLFGTYYLHRGEGTLRIGDPVYVL